MADSILSKHQASSIIWIVLSMFVMTSYLPSCTRDTPKLTDDPDYIAGELIAKRHCSSCHSYVPPALLDRVSWPRVLSIMRLEMQKVGTTVSSEDWNAIHNFYLSFAPPSFTSGRVADLPSRSDLFEDDRSSIDTNLFNGKAMLLQYHQGKIVIGQSDGLVFDIVGEAIEQRHKIDNLPVDILTSDGREHLLGMGRLGPSNDKKGQLFTIQDDEVKVLVDSLIRPIDMTIADLDMNGREEILICSFGSTVDTMATGSLSIVALSDTLSHRVLDPTPGATSVTVDDLNGDGRLDIIALFAQGNEMINVYYNKGDLKFEREVLVAFPPVYGSNSFELVDINRDGYKDILVTSGDNDDYSQVFKPYHGIRIFLNDGVQNFTEAYFYNINGAAEVKSADFDQDGDLDFVVLSMYPDLFTRPWEKLIYFENVSIGSKVLFEQHYLEAEASANWILMDIGDVDQDGDMDIITASNYSIHGLLPPSLMSKWNVDKQAYKVFYNQVLD